MDKELLQRQRISINSVAHLAIVNIGRSITAEYSHLSYTILTCFRFRTSSVVFEDDKCKNLSHLLCCFNNFQNHQACSEPEASWNDAIATVLHREIVNNGPMLNKTPRS